MRLPSSLAALLPMWIGLLSAPMAHAEDEETASVYLPFYNEKWWKDMQGSVLSKDDEKTAYTIFCPTQTPQRCNLAGELPFTFTEGPETLIFHGTHTSTYIMNLECDLEGKTLATCSGYSSFKSGYTAGPYTGTTEITWTSTFSASEVVWAVITLADEPAKHTEGVVDLVATAMESMPPTAAADEIPEHTFPSDDTIFPQETAPAAPEVDGESGGEPGRRGNEGVWASVVAGVGAVVLAAGMM